MRVFLVRHGETAANVNRVIQGQSGRATLTERGKSEVQRAADFLKSQLTRPRVWASDLSRASDSAALICTLLQLPAPTLCCELRQRNWGSSEGRSYDERVGETAYTGTPGADLPSDAESVDSITDRLAAFVNRLHGCGAQEHVVVSHNELLNYLLDHLGGTHLRKRHFLGGEVLLVELDEDGKAIGRPRSMFPPRRVHVPDVRSFFTVNKAVEILASHDLVAVQGVDPGERYDVVGVILGDTPFGVAQAKEFARLRVVSRFGTGFDNVDVDGLWSQCRVTVARTPEANMMAVAEFSVAAITLLLRDALCHVASLRQRRWRGGGKGLELSEASAGIIGCGRIGLEIARRLLEQGAAVHVWNRTWPPTGASEETVAKLERASTITDLVRTCDAISVNVAYAPDTHHLIDGSVLNEIQKSGRKPVLVNTSRGDTVDEHALLDALNEGVFKGVAIDVWSTERDRTSEVVLALRDHPLVLPTPHIAGYTRGFMERAAVACATNIVALVEGRRREVQGAIVAAQQGNPPAGASPQVIAKASGGHEEQRT